MQKQSLIFLKAEGGLRSWQSHEEQREGLQKLWQARGRNTCRSNQTKVLQAWALG